MHGELVPITFFIVFAVIVKIVSDNGIKKRLIAQGKLDENVKYLYADRLNAGVPASLKWGMVLTAVGAALLIAPEFDELTLGLMLVMGGVALIVYYFVGSALLKKKNAEA